MSQLIELADANKRNEQLVAESKKMQEAHALATADLNTKLAEARKGRDRSVLQRDSEEVE